MFYNRVLENIVLPVGDKVFSMEYMKWLRYWRKVQYLNDKQLGDLQSQKLDRILKHTAENIPYYKKYRNNKIFHVKDFPIIKKTDLKSQTDNFLWHPHLKNQLICESSSGSSGIQGSVFMNKREQSKIMALQTCMWEWAGYKIGNPMLQTGMSSKRNAIKKIKDTLFNVDYQLAFGLEEKDILNILQNLRGRKKRLLGGYASSLFLLAETAKNNNLNDIRFESIISWGDKMFSHYRTILETTFAAKVFDIYGSTEGFVIAGQKDIPYYYIFTPQVFLELLDEQGNEVNEGEIGHVVVTHLDAFEMPLIRYDLGDLAIKLPRQKYPKDRELAFPLLERIIGRDSDIIRTKTGKSMIVHSFTIIFEHIPEIRQFRVIQESIEKLTIEYIPDKGFYPEILETISQRINTFLKGELRLDFSQVAVIPSSPSGKPEMIISRL